MPYSYEHEPSDGEGLKQKKSSLRELLINDVRSLTFEFRKLVPKPPGLIEDSVAEATQDSIKIPKPPLLKDIERIERILKKETLAQMVHERLTDQAKKMPHHQWYWFMPFAKDLKIELLKILNKPDYRLVNLLADDSQVIHQENQSLRNENNELRQRVIQLENGTQFKQMVDQYEAKLQNLINENNGLRRENENRKIELEETDEYIAGLTVEMQDLRKDKDNLHHHNVKLIEENKTLKTRIEELERLLKEREPLPRKTFG